MTDHMKVKQKVQLDNRRMQMANMMRQSLAGWNADYHIADDFSNADHGNKWADIGNTVYAVAAFVLALCAVGVYAKVIL